ncbi:hypothetical protein [Natrinema amylolyticum]|uniref:hypothetical protein n=1 Tax=Natrinema amylolyticum TaxID=2878679 RepID=UPI001CFB92AD|nr:hypothetical protein [Natrinema amylolyticum]
MRVSIPGAPGVYFDTDAESTAINVALTAAGRRAPKPQGYAIQALPYLWSFDVDLQEVPNDHPIQYLHPEGARSLGELSPQRGVREAGTELESVLRFVWSVNEELETATTQLLGAGDAAEDGVTIEIQEGSVGVDGSTLETDEFDIDESETETSARTEIDIDDGDAGGAGDSDEFGFDESDPDDEVDTDDEFDLDGESDPDDEF